MKRDNFSVLNFYLKNFNFGNPSEGTSSDFGENYIILYEENIWNVQLIYILYIVSDFHSLIISCIVKREEFA